MTRNYRYATDRLLLDEWHSLSTKDWPDQNLVDFVKQTLTEKVTAALPPAWQGEYSIARAHQWISERDKESTTLLAIDKKQEYAIGLVILFEDEDKNSIRLGYLLNESAWGQGYASELINGLVQWCEINGISSLTGGVERDNTASRRVLEKCGFQEDAKLAESGEQTFSIQFA